MRNDGSSIQRNIQLAVLICFVAFYGVKSSPLFSVENVKGGEHKLHIEFLDSVDTPDLSQLQVSGNEVENAIFVQQNSLEVPTILQPGVLSIPERPEFGTTSWDNRRQRATVLAPSDWEWELGQIVIDTVQGGIAHKIIAIGSNKRIGNRTEWELVLRPAKLEEIVLQCDLMFASHPNLDWTVPDSSWHDFQGESLIQVGMSNITGYLDGEIQGFIKVSEGRVEVLELDLAASIVANGRFQVQGVAREPYRVSNTLPLEFRHWIPVDTGLYIPLIHRWEVDWNYESTAGFPFDTVSIKQELNLQGRVEMSTYHSEGGWVVSSFQSRVLDLSEESLAHNETKPSVFKGYLEIVNKPSMEITFPGYEKLGVTTALSQMQKVETSLFPHQSTWVQGNIHVVGKTFAKSTEQQTIFSEHSGVLQTWRQPPTIPDVWIEELQRGRVHWDVEPDVVMYQVQLQVEQDGMQSWESIVELKEGEVPPVSIPTQYIGKESKILRLLAKNKWGTSVSEEIVLEGFEPISVDSTIWVEIPGGTWSPEGKKSQDIQSFYMQRFEVTQKAYESVTKRNPSYWKGNNKPVERINWNEAASYCEEIGARLPTESEWEYAASAGQTSEYYWGNARAEDHAWFFKNSNKETHDVGTKEPNRWGLYDMSGNVFEWTQDWFQEKKGLEQVAKVVKGGSWLSDKRNLKVLTRFKNRPSFSSYKLGFRCAIGPKESNAD